MKKQYEAVWFTIDGNRHTLFPIYAVSCKAARVQVTDFINFQKKKEFTDMDSITVKEH